MNSCTASKPDAVQKGHGITRSRRPCSQGNGSTHSAKSLRCHSQGTHIAHNIKLLRNHSKGSGSTHCTKTVRCCASVQLAPSSSAEVSWDIYDRVRERELLAKQRDRPSRVLVVTGERSCGKTTMLTAFAQQPHVCMFNLREIFTATPQAFAAGVVNVVLPKLVESLSTADATADWAQRILFDLQCSLPVLSAAMKDSDQKGFTADAAAVMRTLQQLPPRVLTIAAVPKEDPLEVAFALMQALLEAWSNDSVGNSQLPVIIFDEADKLFHLRDYPDTKNAANAGYTCADNLHNLGQFLTKLTKEDRCLVILSSTEYWFMKDLNTIGISEWTTAVIGRWNSEDAQGFFKYELRKLLRAGEPDTEYELACETVDDNWDDMYEVVGGNADDLVVACSVFVDYGCTWDIATNISARDEVLSPMQEAVHNFLYRGGPGFSAHQFADAALFVIEHGGAVPFDDMSVHLGRFAHGNQADKAIAGKALLMAMIDYNALYARPWSEWATDVAHEEHGDIVTASSPLQLYCLKAVQYNLRKLRKELEKHTKRRRARRIRLIVTP